MSALSQRGGPPGSTRRAVALAVVGLSIGVVAVTSFTGFSDTVTEYEDGQRDNGHLVTMSCSSIAAGGEHLGNFLMNVEWVPSPCEGEPLLDVALLAPLSGPQRWLPSPPDAVGPVTMNPPILRRPH